MPSICCGSAYAFNQYTVYQYGKFRVVPTEGDLVECIRWVGSVGFAGIELAAVTDKHLDRVFGKQSVSRLREAADEQGIKIPLFTFTPLFAVFPGAEMWTGLKDMFVRGIEAAQGLGSKIIETRSPPFPDATLSWNEAYPAGPPSTVTFAPQREWKERWDTYASYIGELSDIAQSNGVMLAIEPRPREFIGNTDAMLLLLERVSSSHLGVLFDTGHQFAMKEILPVSIWKLGKSIIVVHLTDNDGLIEHQWAPGEGKIDWLSVMQAFKRADYHGDFVIETSGAGAQARDFVKAKKMIGRLLSKTYR